MLKKTTKTENKQKAIPATGQIINGRVVSAKLPQTVVVLVEGFKTHKLYNKAFKRSKRFMVHDEIGVKEGDLVNIVKTRPFSKNKHWQIINIIGRDIEAIVSEQLKAEAAEAVAEVMPVEEKEVIGAENKESKTEKQAIMKPGKDRDGLSDSKLARKEKSPSRKSK